MNPCTCSLVNGQHDPDCIPAQDVAFAELYIAKLDAEKAYRKDPTPENLLRLLDVGREYSRVLRERLDAKARTS